MVTHLLAIALSALLFMAFVAFHRNGCDGSSCGTGAGCGACPNDSHPTNGDSDHA